MGRATSLLAFSLLIGGCAAPLQALRLPEPPREADPAPPRLHPEALGWFLQAEVLLTLDHPADPPATLQQAIELLERALALEPDSASLWRFLAEARSHLPDAKGAVEAAARAAELAPADGLAQLTLGQCLQRLGRLEEAEVALRRAVAAPLLAERRAEAHFLLHEQLQRAGRVDEALAVLDGWARALPEDPRPAPLRAQLLWDAGRPLEGSRAAEEALVLDPAAQGPLDVLVGCYRLLGDLWPATEALERVVAVDWSVPGLHDRLVDLYTELGRYDLALEHHRARVVLRDEPLHKRLEVEARLRVAMHDTDGVLELLDEQLDGPAAGDVPLLLVKAWALAQRGEQRPALEVLETVTDPREYRGEVARLRAQLLLDAGDSVQATEIARAELDQLGRLGSELEQALVELALAGAASSGDAGTCGPLLKRLSRLDPEALVLWKIRLARAFGDPDQALRLAGEAVELRPTDVARVNALADEHLRGGEGGQALGVVQRGLDSLDAWEGERLAAVRPERVARVEAEVRGRRVSLLLRLAELAEAEGRGDLAGDALERAYALAPWDPWVLNSLGYRLARLGEGLDRAEALLLLALDRRLYSGAIQDSLGWVYVQQGRLEEALERLELAVSYAPDEYEIHEHLGDLRERLGRHMQARGCWARALDLAGQADDPAAAVRIEAKVRRSEAQGVRGDP